jgi:hypothetical protein
MTATKAATVLALVTAAGLARADAPDGMVRGEPELDVDERVLVGAVGEQTAAQVAFDGETFLVTWRSALWRNELRASRISPVGQLLEARGVRLDGLERSDGAAAVTRLPPPTDMGTAPGFMVAWTRSDNKITVARLPGRGALVPESPVVVDDGDPTALTGSPTLATTSNANLVAWSRAGATPGIFVRRLPADNLAGGPPAQRIAPTAGAVTLLGEGSGALAAFALPAANRTTAVHVVRLDAQGALTAPPGAPVLMLSGEQPGVLALALGGGRLALAAAAMNGQAFGEARVLPLDLASLQPSGAAITLPLAAAITAGGPTLAWAGDGFTVLWATQAMPGQAAMAGLRLVGQTATTFSPVQLAASPLAGDARAPVLATNGSASFAVWDRISWRSAGAVTDSDVMFAGLTPELMAAPVSATLISRGTNAESEPVVAKSPRRLLVVFEDHRNDAQGADIYAAPLTLEGARAGAAPTVVAAGPARQTAPVVAWDGANFVVAWYEAERGLFAARLSEEGALIDATPVPIKDTAALTLLSEPALCADGDGTLLVYSARRTGLMDAPRTTELRARRIPRGASADRGEDVMLTTTADLEAAPILRMACNDKAALLAFTGVLAPGDPPRLMLARLERGQTIVARVPGIFRLPHRLSTEWAGVGTDGEGFMVNWRAPNRMGQRTVWATRLDGDGYLLDEAPWPVGGANSGRRVSTTWDGQQYVVLTVNTSGDEPFDLVGRRVASSGALSETDWFKVARLTTPFAGSGLGADAVAIGPGRLFVTYEQYADDDSAGNPRARGRVLLTPKGSPIDAAPVEPRGLGDAGVDASDAALDEDARDGAAGAEVKGEGAEGCGCRVGDRGPTGGSFAIALLAALGLARRLHRRSRR